MSAHCHPGAMPASGGGPPCKPVLELALAERMLERALAAARAARLPVSVAICDDGGHLLTMARLDDAPPATAAIAIEKARSAALIRRPGKDFEDLINGGRTALLSIRSLDAMLAGGEPVFIERRCVGAVGVSGGRPDDDARVVRAALESLAP